VKDFNNKKKSVVQKVGIELL